MYLHPLISTVKWNNGIHSRLQKDRLISETSTPMFHGMVHPTCNSYLDLSLLVDASITTPNLLPLLLFQFSGGELCVRDGHCALSVCEIREPLFQGKHCMKGRRVTITLLL